MTCTAPPLAVVAKRRPQHFVARAPSRARLAPARSTSSGPDQAHRRRHVVEARCPDPAGRGTTGAPARTTAAARRSRGRPRCGGAARRARARAASIARASPRRVGASNSARSGTSHPEASRAAASITCVASSEWPPSSKKLSCDAHPRHSSQHLRPDPRQHLLHRHAAPRTRLTSKFQMQYDVLDEMKMKCRTRVAYDGMTIPL